MDNYKTMILLTPTNVKLVKINQKNFDDHKKAIQCEVVEHCVLDGLEPQYKLGLFCDDLYMSKNLSINRHAGKIIQAFKTYKKLDSVYFLKGNVLIYDDDKDLTDEDWTIIKNELIIRLNK
jgi:hypothetical protein